jgi:uncharacterized protein YkwD
MDANRCRRGGSRGLEVGGQGLEPRFSGPKPDVLPLDDPPAGKARIEPPAPAETASARRVKVWKLTWAGKNACVIGSCKYSFTLRAGRAREARALCALLAAVTFIWASPLPGSTVAAATPRARAAASACPGATLTPDGSDIATVDAATLCLINQIRAAHRLHRLHANRYLLGVADSQVTTMVSWDYFADVRPSGQTPLSLVGVTRYPAHAAGIAVGQNIAWGTGSYASPEHIVAEWMASPPHRAVILTGKYRDAGVAVTPAVPGVLRAGHPGAGAGGTYAMEFGVRRF